MDQIQAPTRSRQRYSFLLPLTLLSPFVQMMPPPIFILSCRYPHHRQPVAQRSMLLLLMHLHQQHSSPLPRHPAPCFLRPSNPPSPDPAPPASSSLAHSPPPSLVPALPSPCLLFFPSQWGSSSGFSASCRSSNPRVVEHSDPRPQVPAYWYLSSSAPRGYDSGSSRTLYLYYVDHRDLGFRYVRRDCGRA